MSTPDRPPRSVGIAAALAQVEAAMLLAAGLLLLLISTSVGEVTGVSGGLVAAIGAVAIVLAAVFVRGARQARDGTGRTLLLWLSGAVAVLEVVNVVNLATGAGTGPAVAIAVVFLVIPAAIVWQLLQPATVEWVARHHTEAPRPR